MQIITSKYFLFIVCIIILIITKFIFKIDYMNCNKIIVNHVQVFKDNQANKILIIPFFTYNILPFILAFSINRFKILDENLINLTTIIISILTTMLFTLLLMLIDMRSKILDIKKDNINQQNVIKRNIRETYHTVMLEILIAITALISSFIYLFSLEINYILSLVIYYLLFLLLFNLFIILKRIFNIINSYFEN